MMSPFTGHEDHWMIRVFYENVVNNIFWSSQSSKLQHQDKTLPVGFPFICNLSLMFHSLQVLLLWPLRTARVESG